MKEEFEIYAGFAPVYDTFMDNIPYDAWFAYLKGLLEEFGVHQGLVLELGCGTGNMTNRLAEAGYDMIGLDLSGEMLEEAREKCPSQVLFLQQDMREMELYGTVNAIVCVCDGMNYLLETEDLQKVFRKANNYLEAGGVFIFDMKTRHFYRDILGDRLIGENREDASFLWENVFHPDTDINEYLLTIYQLADRKRDLFSRSEELHYQRAYDPATVIRQMEAAGMELAAVYDAFTREPPRSDSERVYFIAREGYQEGKYYNEK